MPNGGRIYYTRRSQPPFLTPIVESYFKATKDVSFIRQSLPLLEKEYQFWQTERSVTSMYIFHVQISHFLPPESLTRQAFHFLPPGIACTTGLSHNPFTWCPLYVKLMRHPQHWYIPQFRCNTRKISGKRYRRAKLQAFLIILLHGSSSKMGKNDLIRC